MVKKPEDLLVTSSFFWVCLRAEELEKFTARFDTSHQQTQRNLQ
jgi:hypothetical protein